MSLAETVLRDKAGKEIKAADLWHFKPVLAVCLRRPGCLLCREEAIHLWSERDQIESLGIRMVCILHEWREKEVEAFAPAYWGGDLYYDEGKKFHAAVHGGKIKRGNVIDLLNPFSRAWKNMRRATNSKTVQDSNLIGDGMTLGGLLLINTNGDVTYTFREETFGDHAPFEDVMEAVKLVSSKK